MIKWDLKGNACVGHWDLGPYPVNGLAIDPAGTVIKNVTLLICIM